FASLKRYLEQPAGKVMLIRGLWRTGKTYLARQGVASLTESMFKKTVFVKFPYSETGIPKNESLKLFDDLFDAGYRNFFIDECTSICEFPTWAKKMADDFADIGCHVVLIGTDSLSLSLAKGDALAGRHNEIRTTRIPFHEWKRLLEYSQKRDLSVKDYFYYGGILDFDGIPVKTALIPGDKNSFQDPKSIDYYLYSAAALNLQNTIARNMSPKFASLRPLWEDGRLIEAVMRVVQDQNHELAGQELAKRFKHNDFYEAYACLKKYGKEIRRLISKEEERILSEIEDRLCISHGRLQLSKEERETVKRYLRTIEVFDCGKVRVMPSADPEERKGQKPYLETYRTIQTQPGIRSGQMRLACDIMWKILWPNVSINEADFVNASTNMVEGQMLEDVTFADLSDSLPEGCEIFKLVWSADVVEGEKRGEFDVAVLDRRDLSDPKISLFEVKHERDSHGSETKHMKKRLVIDQITETFGKIVSRTVVYNGETKRRAVLFVNANEFLASIGRDPEAALFPQMAEKWRSECSL
ncbi:MAG: AAA family ATPase, partial [Desulfovibrionaceae bacterium]|nr:AAA family ATPase [Desulfovibrionaceae bacterium]